MAHFGTARRLTATLHSCQRFSLPFASRVQQIRSNVPAPTSPSSGSLAKLAPHQHLPGCVSAISFLAQRSRRSELFHPIPHDIPYLRTASSSFFAYYFLLHSFTGLRSSVHDCSSWRASTRRSGELCARRSGTVTVNAHHAPAAPPP